MWSSTKTLGELYRRDRNSFDILRFVFAIAVIYSHSFALTGNPTGATEIIIKLTKAIDAGSLSVFGFFILSGFLTTQSIENSRNYIDYLLKRLIRIIPAFLVCLIMISFVVGPIFTQMKIGEYLTSDSTWKFVSYNITFNIGEKFMNTPGDLFRNAPFPGDGVALANGSMWTLQLELGCYILLIVLSFFLMLRHRFLMVIFTVILGVLYYLNMKYSYVPFSVPVKQFWVLGSFQLPNFIKFAYYYCMGSLLYLYREKILYSHRFLVLALLLLWLSTQLSQFNNWCMILFPYIVISVGINFSYKHFHKIGDPSYGLYIFSWPIQQMIIIMTNNRIGTYSLFVSAFIATLFVSLLSWRYVEKPCLKLKKVLPNIRTKLDTRKEQYEV
ncbi:acyltransferase [Paenibacillus sp. JJ-223]|uniref:acyltransferase family protein n=1 Tax=Paenibacillus sp. JJ-223 TaxID=2905647 RepID=UPI001F2D9C31|nr:acyltransferase [Paenibacillus sp. JJ-223]CAH1226183.1 hypothetical protein PAECIP111890_05905 [Paenibacillus sp. JJ-223]